jgi:hypothetical protein
MGNVASRRRGERDSACAPDGRGRARLRAGGDHRTAALVRHGSMGSRGMHRRACLGGALALYAALAIGLTWPLAPNAGSHFPGTFEPVQYDRLHTTWMLAHETRALATAPSTLLDAGIYRPEPRTLFYSTLSLGLLPYFAPTFLVTGNPVLALNLAFLACVSLTAWTIHLVVQRWTDDHVAGLVGALSYLMSTTWRWGFVSCATYFVVLQYVPLLVAAGASSAPSRARGMLPLGALIALQCLTDPLYIAPVVVAPLALVTLRRIARPATRAAGLRSLGALLAAGAFLLPVAAGYLDVVARNPDLANQTLYARPATMAPASDLSTVTSIGLHIVGVFGWWLKYNVPLVTLVLLAGVVAARAARRRPVGGDPLRTVWFHCALWALLAFLAAFTHLRFLRGLPRGGLVAVVALCMLGGLAWAECARRLRERGRWATPALAALLVAALLVRPNGPLPPGGNPQSFAPYPLVAAPPATSPVLDALRARTGTVLELPIGRPTEDARALYRSIFHHRPLVNGYSSYYPARHPALRELARALPAFPALRRLASEAGLRTIVLHTAELAPAARAAWDRILRDPVPNDLRHAEDDDGVVVLDWAPPRSILESTGGSPSTAASDRSEGTRP